MKKISFILLALAACTLSFAKTTNTNQETQDLEAYARAYGIIRYYSPNPYALEWEEIDWTYICYKDVNDIRNGEAVETVLGNLISVMAPDATVTTTAMPSSRKIQGDCSEYSYLLHRGCGKPNIPKISRLFNKELREYNPFSTELVPCSENRLTANGRRNAGLPIEATELPEADSIYTYQLSPDLYLNIPHAERADAFSKKATAGLRKSAEKLWHDTMKSHGKSFKEKAGGLIGEQAYKLSTAIVRWNIIQHFYPYHEEDGLQWENHLEEMISAVAALPEGMTDRSGMYEYYNVVRRSLKPVKDAHLITYPSFYFGKLYSLYLPLFYAPAAFEYEDDRILLDGAEVLSINGKEALSAFEEAKELVASSNEQAVCEEALGLLTESPEHNAPFVIELRVPETNAVRTDTLYSSSETPGRPRQGNLEFARVIEDVLVVNPTLDMECYEQFKPYLNDMDQYRAVVFDVRGYPAYDFEKVLQHIIDKPVSTEFFYTPKSAFPDRQHLYFEYAPESLAPVAPHIDIPVYFLANHKTMSWGETVMMLVKDFKLGTIIGSNTRGTNGDATQLNPSAFIFRMTAIKAVNQDGSRHHGTGVLPDIPADLQDDTCLISIIKAHMASNE